MNSEADFSNIPNPGVSPNERVAITAGGGAFGALASFVIDWPANFIASGLWGPAIMVAAFAGAGWFATQVRKSPFRLAIEEFAHLGLSPELIGDVIVGNRAKAFTILNDANELSNKQIKAVLRRIANEGVEIIDSFQDDPSDASRSRKVLNRSLDMTLKIMSQYRIAENRGDKIAGHDATVAQTLDGLNQIASALAEQHGRNMENNQTALEINLDVADQLLRSYSKEA